MPRRVAASNSCLPFASGPLCAYSLRTGQVEHLQEAANFCAAIQERGYLRDANAPAEDAGAAAVLRRLRFAARYVVVALLLERLDVARAAAADLAAGVAAARAVLTPTDAAAWAQTHRDAAAFVEVGRR